MQQIIQSEGNRLVIGSAQDVEPVLEQAKARNREGLHGSSEMRHVARIPMVLVEKYCTDNGVSFSEFMGNPKHVERMCNDPSLEYFRIWKGSI